MPMNEVWKDIQGYEGLYQVSNFGRVRSIDRYVPHGRLGKKFCKGCLMTPHQTNSGYLAVNLCKENKYRSFDIHRLVAAAFVPVETSDAVQVNHKDENKHNNCADNLEWCSIVYNNMYGTKRERTNSKIEKPVVQCDLEGNPMREYKSASAAEREIGGKFTGAISHCLSGKTKTAFGYKWIFKEVT